MINDAVSNNETNAVTANATQGSQGPQEAKELINELTDLAKSWLDHGKREVSEGRRDAVLAKQSIGLALQGCAAELLITLQKHSVDLNVPQGSSSGQ